RPFMLVTLDEFLFRVTDKQLHPRLFAPASIVAFQKMAEEPLLQPDTIIRIELQPVGAAMCLQPFLLRRRPHEGLEITARMEAVPAPVRFREERHSNFLQIGRALAVIVVIERVRECAGDDVASIRPQLFWRQCLGPGNRLASDAAARAALPDAMLHRNNRTRIPVRNEFGIDASLITAFPDMIPRPLPT